MAISIRSPEVEQLARQLSKENGVSMTESIKIALEQSLRNQDCLYNQRLNAIRKLAEECSQLPDMTQAFFDEILGYDEHGVFANGC